MATEDIAIKHSSAALSSSSSSSSADTTTPSLSKGNQRFKLLEPNDTFDFLAVPKVRDQLSKWNLNISSRFLTFRYDEFFNIKNATRETCQSFLTDLFNCHDFLRTFEVTNSGKQWESVTPVQSVEFSSVPCTTLNMGVFDVLYDNDIVSSNTQKIRGCLEERYEGVAVADELRQCLLLENSDKYDIFDDDFREELLFRLFRYFVVGGGMCQWEDFVTPYLDLAKTMYKKLVQVQKNTNTGKLEVASGVWSIESVLGGSYELFPPGDSPWNQCLVCCDPIQRRVHVMYFGFPNYW